MNTSGVSDHSKKILDLTKNLAISLSSSTDFENLQWYTAATQTGTFAGFGSEVLSLGSGTTAAVCCPS